MHDPSEGSRRQKLLLLQEGGVPVDPPTTNEHVPPIVEEALPSAVMADVFGDLEPEEAIESQPGAEVKPGTPRVLLLTVGR